MQSVPHHELHDTQSRRLSLTADEHRAFIGSAATAARPVRTLCMVLHDTGCRISEALALTSESIDLSGWTVMFESFKKRRLSIYRAVSVPPTLYTSDEGIYSSAVTRVDS